MTRQASQKIARAPSWARAGSRKDPVRTGGGARRTSRLCEVSSVITACAAASPGWRRCPRGRRPWPQDPGAVSLRRPRCPGSAGSPTRGREAVLAGKVLAEDRPAPSHRLPGTAGQPGFRRRTAGPRRGPPSPNRHRRFRRSRHGLPGGVPQGPAGSRPEDRGTLLPPARRLTWARPVEKAEALPEPLASLTIGNPRIPHPSRLRLRRAEARGRGPHRRCPALSRARKWSPKSAGATI